MLKESQGHTSDNIQAVISTGEWLHFTVTGSYKEVLIFGQPKFVDLKSEVILGWVDVVCIV